MCLGLRDMQCEMNKLIYTYILTYLQLNHRLNIGISVGKALLKGLYRAIKDLSFKRALYKKYCPLYNKGQEVKEVNMSFI